jgi:hypothetical protein
MCPHECTLPTQSVGYLSVRCFHDRGIVSSSNREYLPVLASCWDACIGVDECYFHTSLGTACSAVMSLILPCGVGSASGAIRQKSIHLNMAKKENSFGL